MRHIDKECESALMGLDDALCSFERTTGRNYLLVLIPESPDEKIHMSRNGKPLLDTSAMNPEEIKEILAAVMERRRTNRWYKA